ncbi:hypothetical protein F5Y08DRAFT_203905 [Xylaria arbuscula]|nr:hypothetical protein F5Y08DRAFT_203905 [Xylaria arbuscula]
MPNSKSKAPPNRGSAPDKKYFQLWRRFYEPLVMLKILGSTRGEHSPKPQQQSPVHRFLDNLAYLADHDKGGSTTSAIGLEDAPDRFNFWIASNEPKQSVKSSIFLASFLQDVRVIADSTNGRRKSLEEKATHRCINFAKNRVKKEAKMLARDITKCMGCFTNPEDTELCEWLKRFQETEPLELCYLAYRERDSPMKGRLDRQLSPYNDSCTMDRRSVAIKDVVHRLGRLAHHVRAPHQVIEDVSNQPGLRNVLDEFQVHFIPSHLVVDRPNAEPNIHIHSIMTRMLPCDGFNAEYREAADTMNRRFDIVKRFKDTYDDKNFSPLMHAEIQVLEHFWGRRQFFEDDRYIGCSKPACYCCHLYMQHHPARCAVPQTSRNVYLNWGLRLLPQGSRDPEYKHQRDILNEMAKSIREDALDQILRKTSAAPWHPDSQTGFTLRVPSVQGEVLQTTIDQAPLTDAMRMVDLDLATDSDESQPSSTGGYASGSRHSSVASMSDDSKRGMRKLSWPVIEDSDDDSDSSSGGAML